MPPHFSHRLPLAQRSFLLTHRKRDWLFPYPWTTPLVVRRLSMERENALITAGLRFCPHTPATRKKGDFSSAAEFFQ
ncbi:hypothetical protein MPNT_50002 [Candidatus Methylacidithermus pantelleriae]|uniref:Uncharacterized protein n=1 Tax=Candidatus Methylacidithermus pantelleriae TaxID=2744239 RepID=A0A8J2BUP9_9BACT|nr:hypothetical protein MPNT_50002 [Candidatus Methylacidithermus pantelleriae]